MTTTKIRTQQVVLDLPTEEAEVWVRAVLQTVIRDDAGNVVQTIDRTDVVHRKMCEFAGQIETIADPVTGNEITISGVGVGVAIAVFLKRWMLDDTPGTYLNESGDIIKE